MQWALDKTRPICRQICDIICVAIVKGEFSPGEKLLSVREVSLLAGVNPNTVQKSFEELEALGVIHSVPCSGWYVNENTETAKRAVECQKVKKSEEYIAAMMQLGCDPTDVTKYLDQCKEEKYE